MDEEKQPEFLPGAMPVNKITGADPPLISADKRDINNLTVQLSIVKGNRVKQTAVMESVRNSAGLQVQLIEKQYGIENE